jgi:hypothetical protein
MGPVFFSLACLPASVLAQNQASLGIGLGVVRHEAGSSFSALTLSPAVQRLTPSFYIGAGGGVSLLERGVWAEQGRADLWAALLPAFTSDSRIAVSASGAASARSDGVAAGAGAVLLEMVWTKGPGGFALAAGPVGGVIQHAPAIGAPRLRGRAWFQQFSVSVENTRFLGAWYTDLVGGMTVEKPRVVGSLWASARVSRTYGSTGAASATVQYFLRPQVALEASGGSYLRDPFQGLPRAGYGGLAIRLFRPRTSAPEPAVAPPKLQPLIAERRGADTAVVRFRMPGAKGVAIAGSWNEWTPAPLKGMGGDIWEATLLLSAGTYYFNLVVDGTDWAVPGGVAVVSDGMGGLVAVLTVPPPPPPPAP